MSTYKIKINSRDYEVSINSIVGNKASVCVNGREYEALVEEPAGPVVAARPKNALNASSAPLNEAVPATPAVAGAVTSPLPGVILSIAVKEGDKVSRGQKLAVLEAMKMENDILAPQEATVKQILVHSGDSVKEGTQLLILG